MDSSRITGSNPTHAYGVGSLKHDRDRRGKRSFEQAFDEEEQGRDANKEADSQSASVADDDTPDGRTKRSLSGDLQDPEGIIRKDEEDGQLHVDVVV